MRWSVLGDDGHIVTGAFDFGVAGREGRGAAGRREALGRGGGRGGEQAASDGVVKLVGRWLGILAASLLFGGFVLLARLRRRRRARRRRCRHPAARGPDRLAARRRSRRSRASSAARAPGTGGALDFGLLTASATGVSELVRASWSPPCRSRSLLARAARRALRDRLYLGGGAAVLLTYALSGHALSFPTFWALLDQGVHVLAAGLWLGGVARARARDAARPGGARSTGARAFAPVAGAALGVAIVTGVLAAVREVDRWYFLRWSDYGRIVIVKAALVAVVALAARSRLVALARRRRARPAPAAAARGGGSASSSSSCSRPTLSGLAQGRGQPLPAQRGTLFPGPALATALLPKANAPVGARPGAHGRERRHRRRRARPADARATSACGSSAGAAAWRRCGRRCAARGGLTWSAGVGLPADGTWFGYVTVDGATAPPVQLAVGVPRAAGAPPRARCSRSPTCPARTPSAAGRTSSASSSRSRG